MLTECYIYINLKIIVFILQLYILFCINKPQTYGLY